MALFQASLTDPITQEASIVVDADCTQLQIQDASNYTQLAPLTGTLAVTNGSLTINGTGTLFLSELSIGSVISIAGILYSVATIPSDVLLTIDIVYPAVSAIGLTYLVVEQQGAHDASDFSDFIKITVEDQDTGVYVFTSFTDPATGLLDGDELIATPSANSNITVNFNITTGDGVYTITLCTIPTYDAAEPYSRNSNDYVFFNNLFYKAENPSTGITPGTNPNAWTEVQLDDVNPKYCTFAKVVVVCNLNKCIDDSTFEAFCTVKEHICDDDILCKNERFLKAMKLYVLDKSIENANTRGAYDDIADMIRLTKSLCKCC